MDLNQRMPRIDASRFSMVPRPDIPRSTFVTTHSHKTTFDAGLLIPIHLDEVLPGDVHHGSVTIFARLSTPLFPIMDQMFLETFFFFIPARILWDNWVKMMGERTNPADTISYTVPVITSPVNGWPIGSIGDYLGLPTVGQVAVAGTVTHNVLPFRAYNLIWNEWFRDQNLQDSIGGTAVDTGNGPDSLSVYALKRRNKQHDYFTSALPWPLKGGQDVVLPLSGIAPVRGLAISTAVTPTAGGPVGYNELNSDFVMGAPATGTPIWQAYTTAGAAGGAALAISTLNAAPTAPLVYADLADATGATINALRLAVQTQRLLERDARSGTRYTELLRAHFGVLPQDARLQRPEYIGGGQAAIQTSAIPQTSATDITGSATPLGALGASAIAADQHSYSYTATEHGYIMGLAHVRAELTYQQGTHKLWHRSTRYDFYWPVFAHLGEQAIENREIWDDGDPTVGVGTFGYQERWAEYRHRPSRITGLFRSTAAGAIDQWHLAQNFASLPVLNSQFIQDNPPLARVLAAGSSADGMQILFDSVFKIKTTRPMPMFSVPGMMDRF